MNITIEVGITCKIFRSRDGGANWSSAKREIPWRTEPICYPEVSLPEVSDKQGEFIDMVHVPDGSDGVAVGHRRDKPERSLVWKTSDGGNCWEPLALEVVRLSEPLSADVWPPEKFDSVVMSADGGIFLAWTDPWLFDDANSHLLSLQGDTASKYQSVDDMCIRLATTRSQCVRAFSWGHFWETTSSRDSWERIPFSIRWDALESCFNSELGLLRWPQFVTDDEGFALVVQRHLQDSHPPITGLARTADGGRHWDVIAQWNGPVSGDMNARHVTDLKILMHAENNDSLT